MKVELLAVLSDNCLDANLSSSQRQLELSVAAIGSSVNRSLPLNLCLILDRSGSMKGRPIETVIEAATKIIEKLTSSDRLTVVAFNHHAELIVSNQSVENSQQIKQLVKKLKADGGTAIDEGMKLGIQQAALGKENAVSQIFLLTDGENEHGDNDRCLKLAQLASEYNITLNTLGFGSHWNQEILEKIADTAGGSLSYIENPDKAVVGFEQLFTRVQSISLTNAYLIFDFIPKVRLAELKPIAQVAPETIELAVQEEGERKVVRLGDLMVDVPRLVLANLYISKLQPGRVEIGKVQVRYDDPAVGGKGLLSEAIPIFVEVQQKYQPQPNDRVQKSILSLAKYRQTQMAEVKLQQGDRAGAATLLQNAAKTALQLGDVGAATVLQKSATVLQTGEELSEAERKKTKIVSKTILQG